jgi:hypothetical protein
VEHTWRMLVVTFVCGCLVCSAAADDEDEGAEPGVKKKQSVKAKSRSKGKSSRGKGKGQCKWFPARVRCYLWCAMCSHGHGVCDVMCAADVEEEEEEAEASKKQKKKRGKFLGCSFVCRCGLCDMCPMAMGR